MLRKAASEVEVVNGFENFQYFGEKLLIHRFLDVSDVVTNVLGSRRANERGGDVGVGARVLHCQLDDVLSLSFAMLDSPATAFNDGLARWMPIRYAAPGEQAHSGRRGVDDAETFLF